MSVTAVWPAEPGADRDPPPPRGAEAPATETATAAPSGGAAAVVAGGGYDGLDGEELLRRFEAGELAADRFHHPDHVRLTWEYHRRLPPAQVLERLGTGLRRLAAAGGHPERYHETITWAYALLVRERMERAEEASLGGDWDAFRGRNPDLFDWAAPVVGRYYRSETLASPLARRVFLLPDRVSSSRPRRRGDSRSSRSVRGS